MSKIAVNEITDEVGTGAPAFPNGVSVTGAALTDPEITGGIYLGGTGSANYLDDYEEGTWTPVATSGTGSITSYTASGKYTKFGDFVSAFAIINFADVGTAGGNLFVTLPFSDNYSGAYEQPTSAVRETNSTGNIFFARLRQSAGEVNVQTISGGGITWNSSYRYCFQFNYFTTS